jgi:lipopolysaccharide/colanic/teichoic acid biosynthesis glycosyltransferase
MALDLEYIDSWSPRLDLEILLKTIPAVLSGRGAS